MKSLSTTSAMRLIKSLPFPISPRIDEDGLNTILSTSIVSNEAQMVGVIPKELTRIINIQFLSSRKVFSGHYCHGWINPDDDHTIFIDVLFRTRYELNFWTPEPVQFHTLLTHLLF
jgi:hypothetical protein